MKQLGILSIDFLPVGSKSDQTVYPFLIYLYSIYYLVFKWAQSGRQITLLCWLQASAKIGCEEAVQASDGPGEIARDWAWNNAARCLECGSLHIH